MYARTLGLLGLVVIATTATQGWAQSYATYGEGPQTAEPNLMLGAALQMQPKYPGAGALTSHLVPVIKGSKEITPGNIVYVQGATAGLNHTFTDRLSLGVFGHYRDDRTPKDAETAGLDKIDGTVEVGPKLRYQFTPQWGAEAALAIDAGDASNGYAARLGTDYTLPVAQATWLTATAGLNYGSKQFNNAYYGVKPSQGTPARPATSPGAGFNGVDVGVGATQGLSPHLRLVGRAGAKILTGDVANSPVTRANIQPQLSVGLAYAF